MGGRAPATMVAPNMEQHCHDIATPKKREHKRRRRQERRQTQIEARKHIRSEATASPAEGNRQAAIAAPSNKTAPPRLAALSTTDPSNIVKDPSDKVGIFFLMLSVVFNDVKDLIELTLLVQSTMQTAPELDRHELRGRHTTLHRFIAGVLHELMELILNERTVLDEDEFKQAVQGLPSPSVDLWNSIALLVSLSPRTAQVDWIAQQSAPWPSCETKSRFIMHP
jgi:hypothetical protein